MSATLHETAPAGGLDRTVAEDASPPTAWSPPLAGDASDPAKPPAERTEQLLAIVVRGFPNGGTCLEAAVRAGIELGWAARHRLGANAT
ncbi:hypothetical protein GGQ80_000821 [Sphingomonas jinjuensis]|uniref:Uncharacterized protein n=1 Tax=Sphingomonas jinjuensis TaxID=535907 RepID=A0A840F0V5_9SPHN|nr:hypothetical protein [Sphingomonas jinjuensis]MBB4152933.1 hypothetical protein [Sphingomonas jinjuensis]